MNFNINFNMDNAAFEDDQFQEVKKILDTINVKFANGKTEGNILDSNGNTCGSWSVTE